MDTSYWQKVEKLDKDNKILWNIPEQKTGVLQVIGGNSQNFVTEIRITEFLNSLNLKEVRLLLPDTLRKKVPPVPGVVFAPSTDSGSFDNSKELKAAIKNSDTTIFSGELSKNSITAVAISEAIKDNSPTIKPNPDGTPDKPIVITRDAVDLLSDTAADFIDRDNLFIVASMAQLQKLFRSLLYPKMILLSSPIFPVVETLHKFTLSYRALIVTFHEGQIIIAHSGNIITIPIDKTSYVPISLWGGTLAAKIATLNLWNPGSPLEATTTAVLWNEREQHI